jgi:cytochrome c oxidase assembly protein subunit 11
MSLQPQQLAENRQLLVKLSIVAVLMFGFGYALVPFYDKICQALGINNLAVAEASAPVNTQVDRSRSVTIELDGNAHNLPWRFRPLVNHVQVHPGETMTVEFEIVNVRDSAVTGQAVPSYGPKRAGEHFRKLDCFCFKQQTLAAGETRRMPVVFIIDPKLPADLNTITLSYTFFEVPGLKGKS